MKKDIIQIIIGIAICIFLLWAYPGFSQVTASWNKSEGATGYKLYFGTSSRDYIDHVTVYDTEVQIPLSRFERERTYFFTLTAFNSCCESGFGDEVSFFIVTGIDENIITFDECDEVKTYNVLGQEIKSDRTLRPSGWYVRRCFVGDIVVGVESEVLVK